MPPAELDRRCSALIDFCADKDIPIMAHCTPQGMEVAAKRHTGFNADPEFWRAQIRKHQGLRLCFAHAGGSGHWFNVDSKPEDTPPRFPWATTIIELCTTYANVYTDLSHMGEALESGAGDRFAQTLADDIAKSKDKAYPLSGKVIYGTDFPMPLPSGGWAKYYGQILRCISANEAMFKLKDQIFRSNAVAFLNIRGFLDKRGGDLTPEQARFLAEYAA